MCHPQQQTRDKLYYWSCCRTFLGCTTAEPPWYSGLPTVSPVTHWITALLSYVPGFYGMVAPCLAFLGFHCTMAPLPCVSGVSLYHGPTALRFWGFTVSWSHCLAFLGFHCITAPLPYVSGVSLYHGPTALHFGGFTVQRPYVWKKYRSLCLIISC